MKNRNFIQKSRILRDTPTGKPAVWSNTDIEFPMKFNILYKIDLAGWEVFWKMSSFHYSLR